jgi:large subunit ribosomal protein L15
MATRRRRTRRLRGSRTHGWGRSGQHRGSGNQGGHGNAGWKRHKWSAVIRYGLQIRETGFKSRYPKVTRYINVGDLNLQLAKFLADGYAKQNNGKIDVDLRRAGYQKLLGEGAVDKPLRVIVPKCSELATKKISQAGGEVVLPSSAKED